MMIIIDLYNSENHILIEDNRDQPHLFAFMLCSFDNSIIYWQQFLYENGVQVCGCQSDLRRVIRLTMCQHATTGLNDGMACYQRPDPTQS